MHQGSVLGSLLFAVVMEVITRDKKTGLPWDILYADDLVLMAMNKEELKKKIKIGAEDLKKKG